jgi:hypothetical protein
MFVRMVEPSQLLIGGGYISLSVGWSRNAKFLIRALQNLEMRNKTPEEIQRGEILGEYSNI